jgi:hypothetical protein
MYFSYSMKRTSRIGLMQQQIPQATFMLVGMSLILLIWRTHTWPSWSDLQARQARYAISSTEKHQSAAVPSMHFHTIKVEALQNGCRCGKGLQAPA